MRPSWRISKVSDPIPHPHPDAHPEAPLAEGTACQQPNGCAGVSILNADECRAPCRCAFCNLVLCDMCAAGVNIPAEELGEPSGKVYDAFVCDVDFNEDWV